MRLNYNLYISYLLLYSASSYFLIKGNKRKRRQKYIEVCPVRPQIFPIFHLLFTKLLLVEKSGSAIFVTSLQRNFNKIFVQKSLTNKTWKDNTKIKYTSACAFYYGFWTCQIYIFVYRIDEIMIDK